MVDDRMSGKKVYFRQAGTKLKLFRIWGYRAFYPDKLFCELPLSLGQNTDC